MKKTARILVPLLMTGLIVASIGWYLFVYDRDFTRDSLLEQARFQDEHGNARISSMFYNTAYNFSDKDQDVAIELANQYKADGNYTKAELTLTSAINTGATVELYTALCRTYVEQDKLLDAVNLLDNIADPNIRDRLLALRPTAPQADYPAGYYNQYMDIHLNSSASTVYYTTDGEYPSIRGAVYDLAIPLPTGETTIYAIAVDDQGLVSPVTILGYTITGVIEPVKFKDPVMEEAIRILIKADPEDTVYTNQLWEITQFTAPENVTDFSDIAQMPYLVELTIHDQKIDTLSHLSGLAKLEKLDLYKCRFPGEELDVLAQLPVLSHLSMQDCSLTTLEGLAGAPALSYLNLNENALRDLSVLSDMQSLKELYLSVNALDELDDLSGLANLEKLDISHNEVISLNALYSCPKLSWLHAGNNKLEDITDISSLPLLHSLFVDHNQLTDVTPLTECADLEELDISSNQVEDISGFGELTKLKIFSFAYNSISELPTWPDDSPMQKINGSHNAISSVDCLSNLNELTDLTMEYNQLTDVDALENNYCLIYVNVYGNEIEDVSKLRERDIIVNYDPS